MKTLYISDSGKIIFDVENNKCAGVKTDRESINNIQLVNESMHVIFESGEHHKEFDVEPGDIIVTFYRENIPNRVVVAKSDEWVENIQWFREEEQKEKERWAKAQAVDLAQAANFANVSCKCDEDQPECRA